MFNLQTQSSHNLIKQEFEDINRNPISSIGLTVGLLNNIFEWQATLIGPHDSLYKNGLFILKIKFPDNFPQTPPEICFLTPIYHLNVNPYFPRNFGAEPLGHIFISILNNWKPEYKMREVLTNISSLFYLEDPYHAYGVERANEMKYNPSLHNEKIKYFTKKYADPSKRHVFGNYDWDFSFG